MLTVISFFYFQPLNNLQALHLHRHLRARQVNRTLLRQAYLKPATGVLLPAALATADILNKACLRPRPLEALT